MDSFDLQAVLEEATVPEHSAAFMKAMSGGEPFLSGPYLFLAGQEWMIAVGYPLGGDYSPETFGEAISDALRRTRARDCWAICPSLPDRLKPFAGEHDQYYVLAADSAVPSCLHRQAKRAAASLRVEQDTTFSGSHRRLWAEFMGRIALPPKVRELFARTEQALPNAPGLVLLNAWNEHGHLVACLLLDTAPHRFLSYLIGAHSRSHYVPHASDLLFFEMIRLARQQNKQFLHLGLGVNAGIRRFKVKWGAVPAMTYEMAAWQEKPRRFAGVTDFMRVLASMPIEPGSKRQYLASLPPQKTFSMLWEIEKEGRRSWIGGTAHFFCYSFEHSFRSLFEKVDTVLLEGPLDRVSLDQVSQIGRSPEPEAPSLAGALTEDEICRLERVVCGPRGFWARLLGLQELNPPDVRYFLSETRHWMAFFSLWTSFLARLGWRQSVDLEAWQIAHEMGKEVRGMESIPEQIETLEGIPIDRIVGFFRQCHRWNDLVKRNMQAYLKGDLDAMMDTSIDFPSRTEQVINRRDARFFERMLPTLSEGRCVVFVGSAHMLNLRHMLVQAGFTVRRSR